MDELEYAKQNLINSYKTYVEAMIHAIFTYIWPHLFEEDTKDSARESLRLALTHVDEYPLFERDKYQNLCTRLFAKLAWHYAEDAKIKLDDHYKEVYALLLDKGWQPTLEDAKIANYAANKDAYMAYLYNKDPDEVTKLRLCDSVEARVYRNDAGVICFTGNYVNLDLKGNSILGVDFDGEYCIKIGDVIGEHWKVAAIKNINDSVYIVELLVIQ